MFGKKHRVMGRGVMANQAVSKNGAELPGAETGFRLPEGMLASVIEASPIGMLLVDAERRIVFANHRIMDIFGYDATELSALAVEDLMPTRFRAGHPDHMQRYIAGASPRAMAGKAELKGLTRDGREVDLEIGLSPVELDGRTLVLASIIDVTDRHRVRKLERDNRELSTAAYRDPLTNLPNRRLFLKQVDDLRDLVIRHHARIVVMFMDLDGFKAINDRHGHAVGDELLRQVAAELNANVRNSDVVSRIGGDEFLICYADVSNDFDAAGAADRLVKAVAGITGGDRDMPIGASIGAISTGLDPDLAIEDIVKAADRLMYKAKLRGKNQAVLETYDIYPER